MIAWITSRLYLLGALLMTVLTGLVWHKRVVRQRDHWKEQALAHEADARARKAHKARKEAAEAAMENDEIPEHLRNPRDY